MIEVSSRVMTVEVRRPILLTRATKPSTTTTSPISSVPSIMMINPLTRSLKVCWSPRPKPTSKAAEPAQMTDREIPTVSMANNMPSVYTTYMTNRFVTYCRPMSTSRRRKSRRSTTWVISHTMRRVAARIIKAASRSNTVNSREPSFKFWSRNSVKVMDKPDSCRWEFTEKIVAGKSTVLVNCRQDTIFILKRK